ncbi:MAG: hypothetical protein H6R18_1081 [Proteobacteria bacterium]|nr:hypothetical protein [Pseudomonadota bacterium]
MNDNPFQTPRAEVDDVAQSYGDIRVFGFEGRLGRLRYLSYSFVSAVITYFGLAMVVGILAAILIPMFANRGGNDLAEILFVLVYVAVMVVVLVVQAQYGVRRLHDLNQNGWLWLLMLIPIVNLIFGLYLLFARGQDTANNYGLPPPPNTTGVWISALGVPFFFCAVFGILAAIAIPSFQDFKTRGEGAATRAEFNNLLANAMANASSADEIQTFLTSLPNDAASQYPNLQLAVNASAVEVRFKKPKYWSEVQFTLKAQIENEEVQWKCQAQGASSKSHDSTFDSLRRRCQALGEKQATDDNRGLPSATANGQEIPANRAP